MIINLWKETISKLEANGLTWDDVETIWIEWEPHWDKPMERCELTKKNFKKLAKDTEYDNDFGHTEINEGLCLWGHDKAGQPFVMVRNGYDGAERWDLHILHTGLPIKEAVNLGDSPFEERWSE